MPWFKIDDTFYRHRKVRKLGSEKISAIGLWGLAGTWCAENLTDGFVPRSEVVAWDSRFRYAKRLVDVGLWEVADEDGEPGWQFHDWAQYQPKGEDVEADREAWRQKKAAWRKKQKDRMSTEDTPGDTEGDTPKDTTGESTPMSKGSPGIPVPVPVPSSGAFRGEGHLGNASAKKPSSKCPDHENQEDPPPCGKCRAARLTAEQWHRDQSTAVARCGLCDGDGWRWDPAGKHRGVTNQRCTHRREQQATG
jgi:hypothetical protein